MEEPAQIVVSRDGRNAYAEALGALVALRRNRATGELTCSPAGPAALATALP